MQILATSPEERASGFPTYIITGVNLTAADPQDSVSQVRIVLEETLAAVRNFNDKSEYKIDTVGFWVMDLTRGVTLEQLSELFHGLFMK